MKRKKTAGPVMGQSHGAHKNCAPWGAPPHATCTFIVALLSVCVLLVGRAEAAVVSANELIENAKEHDGQVIEYEGEVIGDIMARGAHAWMNVSDGTAAIGIFTDAAIKAKINHTGSYKERGDWVLIRGEFHRACSVHGGELDIHAEDIEIMRQGQALEHPADSTKWDLALWLWAGVALLIIGRLIIWRIRLHRSSTKLKAQ